MACDGDGEEGGRTRSGRRWRREWGGSTVVGLLSGPPSIAVLLGATEVSNLVVILIMTATSVRAVVEVWRTMKIETSHLLFYFFFLRKNYWMIPLTMLCACVI